MARAATLRAGIAVVLLLGAAYAVVQWEPWHGPIILTLSTSHGIHGGDLLALPLIALAVGIATSRAQDSPRNGRWPAGRWALPASAVLLGALLLLTPAGEESRGRTLLPAGGGTFGGGEPEHADGQRSDPAGRWSYLAVTYDGADLRLYVNGTRVSRRAITGTIPRTSDPLWIGGNHPYGEFFDGLIDDVRIYDRALTRRELRHDMATPIGATEPSPSRDLVGAYAFNDGSGTVARDASGMGNTGAIIGATWASHGRFGGALRFNGRDDLVRVRASRSLDLRHAMTLSAWSRPSGEQDGWRTILHRQTDAYFLSAGGGTYEALGGSDNARAALLAAAGLWFCLMLVAASGRRIAARRRSPWLPVALFLAGSLADAAFAPTGTLLGPTLLAAWYALTASHRGEAAIGFAVAALFTGVTLASLTGGIELARDDGGTARSVTVGLLLVTAGLLSAYYGRPGSHYGRPGSRTPTAV